MSLLRDRDEGEVDAGCGGEDVMMTFGSLFDGIGCFSLGLVRAGMTPRWLVEIEADCRRVAAAHFPGVPQFEDVRKCGAANLEPVDVIVAGFPCQNLSIAGKREGLTGEKSILFYDMVRVTNELQPSYLIWENVPGILSSDGGRDFGRVLLALDRIGFGGAWTVLDAKWFGVPQRRRRVFGVFARGDSVAERASEILAFAARRAGHSSTRREAGAGLAPSVTPGARRASGNGGSEQIVAGTIGSASNGRGWNCDIDRAGAFVTAATLQSRQHGDGVNPPGRGGEDDQNLVIGTLTSHSKRHGHAMTTQQAAESGQIVFQANGSASERSGTVSLASSDDNGSNQVVVGPLRTNAYNNSDPTMEIQQLVTHALRSSGADASEDGTGRGTPLVIVDSRTGVVDGPQQTGDDNTAAPRGLAPTTPSSGENRRGTPEQSPVAFNWQSGGSKNFVGAKSGYTDALGASQTPAVVYNPHRTLQKDGSVVEGFKPDSITDALHGPTDANKGSQRHAGIREGMVVRRLCPLECERLQGLPDDWTILMGSDSSRYRAIGNGGAVPVMAWIGRRLMAVHQGGTTDAQR